jgi:hypothetical protein
MTDSITVPNTLTIKIRTRLQDETEFKYKPDNTILNYDGKNVYFNPLVKLSKNVTRSIPDNVSRNYLYTQFFNEKQFKGLLQRTLSNPSTAQPKRSINDPTIPAIIDNNIQVTLNALFSPNTKFFIGKNLYTIYSYGWEPGAWKVDAKKTAELSKRPPRGGFYGYGYGYGYPGYGDPSMYYRQNREAQREAKKEFEKLAGAAPDAMKGSNADLLDATNQFFSTTGRGVGAQRPPAPLDSNTPTEEKRDIVKEQRAVIDKIDPNPTFNAEFPEQRSLCLDPVSLSLFYSQQTEDGGKVISFEDYLKKHPGLSSTFKKVVDIRTALIKTENDFNGKLLELFKFNNIFTDVIDDFFRKIKDFRSITDTAGNPLAYDALYRDKKDELLELFNKYVEGIIQQYKLIIDGYALLKTFFSNELIYCDFMAKFMSTLLDYFKKDSTSSPFSILKKMLKSGYGVDSQAYQSILKIWEDTMRFDVEYFKNIPLFIKADVFFKKMDKRVEGLKLFMQRYEGRKYNAQDRIKRYYVSGQLLYCEEYQFLVYTNELFLNYHKTSSYMWKLWHNMTQQFFERSTSAIQISMNLCNERLVSYEAEFTEEERSKLKDLLKVDKSASALASPLMVNALVKNDTPRVKEQKKLYSRLLLCALESYDLILYYSYLSEINCLRYKSFIVSNKNVLEIELSINGFWKQYFTRMGYAIADLPDVGGSGLLFVPESLIIDVGKFTGNKGAAATALSKMQDRNTKDAFLLSKQITILKKKEVDVIAKCQETLDLLLPTIEKEGVRSQCNVLMGTQQDETEFASGFTSSLEALQIALQTSNVDFKLTPKFDLIMDELNDRMKLMLDIGTGTESKLTLNSWAVVDPSKTVRNNDSLLQCICDAFNGQLQLTGSVGTDDVYTEEVDGKRIFTVDSLKKGILDNYGLDTSASRQNFVISLVEVIFQVKIIAFNLCKTDVPSSSLPFPTFQEGESVRFTNPDPKKNWQQGELHISRVDKAKKEYSVRNETTGETVRGIKQDELRHIRNIFDKIQIVQSQKLNLREIGAELERNINSFVLLVLTPDDEKCEDNASRKNSVGKYKLLLNSHIGDFVLKYEQIPRYLQFLIWYSVVRMNRNPEFGEIDIVNDSINKITDEKRDYEADMAKKERDDNSSNSMSGGKVVEKFRGQRGGSSTRHYNSSNLASSSKLTYYIVVDLELYPGRSIPITQRASLSCQVKKNNILSLLSQLMGTQFIPSTMYVFDPKRIAKYYNNRGIEQKKEGDKKRQQTRNLRQGYYSGNRTRSLRRPGYGYNPGNRYYSNYRPGYY